MRMFFLCAALLFPSLALGQTVSQQGYTGGNATIGGCTGVNTADVSSLPVGQCLQGKDGASSFWINDCWSNGVVSLTSYKGSTTCAPASVSNLTLAYANVNGTSVNRSYCNVDPTVTPTTYDTLSCSAASAAPTWDIQVNVYPALLGATNCSGTKSPLDPQVVHAGKCTQLTGTGNPDPLPNNQANPPLFVLANCANTVVTAVMYLTPDCSVQFDSTGQVTNTSVVGAFGPFSQIGAAAAVGKADGTAGAACGVTNNKQAFISFTCINTAPTSPTTTQPPTAPPKNGTATALTAGLAVAILPILATVL